MTPIRACMRKSRPSAAQLVGNIHGYVTGPAFGGIEGDDADRIFILPVEQVSDQRRAISSRFVGLRCGSKAEKLDASICFPLFIQ
jgi:hypothetical protein